MMVLSRTDSKRRRKDDNDVLQESPKRTKVHAQRKFAQGSSSLTSPALTPVKDKVKVNGITPPSDVLPVKRPNTEDFLTFLCFRGTKILPARLDFFSNASIPEPQDEHGVGGSSSSNTAGPSKSNTRLQEKNNSDKSPGNSSNVKPRSQPTSAQGRAVKALKKKYHEQRLAKQKKTTLTKLVQKVTNQQTRYGTRSSTVQLGVSKKQSRTVQQSALLPYAKAKKVMPAKPIKPNLTKVTKHKHKQLRLGLRSGGQLPPGSDIGIKSPVRRPRVHTVQSVSASNSVATVVVESVPAPVKAVNINNSTTNKNSKSGVKPIASSLSDFSSDDDQPLVKKSRKSPPLKAKAGTKSLVIRGKQSASTNSHSSSTGRPSRKTKEAATLYMEMLGKDLRSPDEYDDDALSVESFPELPNKKKIELREKELKALAEKNLQDKEDKPLKVDKLKPVHHTLKKNVAGNKVANVQSIDDRSKRILLRNKAKTRMFRDKEKAKKILKRSRKTAAVSNRGRIVGSKNKKVNIIKTTEEKNILKNRRGLASKRLLVETNKVSLPSSSPVKSPSVPCIVTEQEVKTKEHQFEDNYSESDEEPLKVLSAKLPKKKKNAQEDEIPVERKDVTDLVSKSSASPERSTALKCEKQKLSKRPETKDIKKISNEDKKDNIRNNEEKSGGLKGKEMSSKKQVKQNKGKSAVIIHKKDDVKVKDRESEEIKGNKIDSKKQVKDDKGKSVSVVHKKEDIRDKGDKNEEVRGKEMDSKNQVKEEKEKSAIVIHKKEDIEGKEEKCEELKGKGIVSKKQVKDDKVKSVSIIHKKEDKVEKIDEIKIKEIDSKKQVKDNEVKSAQRNIETKSDKLLNKSTIDTNKDEEKSIVSKENCKEELKNLKKTVNKSVKENTVAAVKSDELPICEEKYQISKNKSEVKNETITEIKIKVPNETVKELGLNEMTPKNVAEMKSKSSGDNVLTDTESTVVDKSSASLLENIVSTKLPPFSDKKSISVSDKKPIPISVTKSGSVSEKKPLSLTDVKPTPPILVLTPDTTNEKCTDEIIKKTEDLSEIKKPVVGSSKISLKPSSSKNKSETSKTLQTCDSSNKNNVNKIEKSKSLCVDNDKPINSDIVKILPSNISQPVKSEDAILINDKVVEKIVKSEEMKLLPMNNKVIKSANSKSFPPTISCDNLNTFQESSKISSKNRNENNKSEDKPCFGMDRKSSDNCGNKVKHEEIIPLPTAPSSVVAIKSEDMTRLSINKSRSLKSIDAVNISSSHDIVNNNGNPNNKEKFDIKEIPPGSSLTKTDLKSTDNEPKKTIQDVSKLMEKQVSKSKNDLCDNVIADQISLSKTIEPKIISTKIDYKCASVKKINTKVTSPNNEKITPNLRPDEDLKKPPTCFTGLLKQQDSGNPESEISSKSKLVSGNDLNIAKEGNHSKASNFSVKCEEKLLIKPKSDEIIKRKEDKNHPTPEKSNKTGKESELSFSSKANTPVLNKTSMKEKTDLILNSGSSKTKTIIDVKSNTAATSSPGKKSVSDIWFSAFKNAKIPKPGQSSPKRNEQVPFVRKPFAGSSLKKQINFSSGSASEQTVVKKDLHEDIIKVNKNSPASTNLPNLLSATKKTPFLSSVTTVVGSRASTTVTTVVSNEVKQTTDTTKNVIDPETLRLKEAEVEDIVRRYVGCELEKMHAGLRNVMPLSPSREVKPVENVEVFQSKTGETIVDQRTQSFVMKVIDKQQPLIIASDNFSSNNIVVVEPAKPLVQFCNKLPDTTSALQNKPPAEKDVSDIILTSTSPVRNDPSSVLGLGVNPPAETSVVAGKHHHLLPVEQTLKKLSQSKGNVSRKPNVSSPNMKQQLSSQPQDNQLIVPSTSSLNLQSKEKEPLVSQKPFYSDIENLNDGNKKTHINLISKRKVNMSTEDINKWLNDSTSACIEHTKNCGIFEKNQCECKPTFSEVVNEPIEQEIICKSIPGEEETTAKSVSQNLTVENVDKKETSTIIDSVVTDKPFGKAKEVNSAVSVKNIVEKKVNVAVPVQNKLPSILPAKPDIVPVASKSINVSESNKPSDEKNLFHKTVTPSCDGSLSSNLSKLKVSRGTNKMGDSEAENSSRDPSEVSSPPPREDLSSADESPDKFVQPERRSIFQLRRSAFRSKLPISRSPSAFSPENESSVYAFEPDLPMTSTPFRRNKSKEGRVVSTPEDDGGSCSTSIAVQVNLDNEAVLECSTQTETDYDESEGHLFYIPLQQNASEAPGGTQQVFQGVAVKLGTEGPDQRVIMRAKLVTKPPLTFASSSSRPLVSSRDIKGNAPRPEQKVKPLSISSNTPRPPVGTVQPTTRIPNPPDITPPPVFPAVPMKRIPTPERIKKISQSPEVPRKDDSNPALFLSTDNIKKDLPVTVDSKSSKEVPVATQSATTTAAAAAAAATADKVKTDLSLAADQIQKLTPSPSPSSDRSVKSSTPDLLTKESSVQPSTSKSKSPTLATPSRGRKPRQQSKNSRNVLDPMFGGLKTNQKSKSKNASASDGKGSFGIDGNIKLQDAPSFHPTEREFQDPLEYIEKIRPLAEKYGLCRIIPPSNFKPECKVSDDMRFTAYNQYVHKMLHRWGPNVKEMLAIKKYLATQSIALTHPPWIGGMEVDLPKLYQTVQNCGGLKEVIEKKRWQRVADAMRIPKSAQDRVTKLDDIYCKYLLPYDTLSHEERTKLFEEVEKEWEKRVSSTNSSETDSNDSSDNSDLDECIVKGRNMALSGFYRIARNTMAVYFRSEQPAAHDVEAEFWNHVGTRQSHVCVHSGSIDSGSNGYGFPTAKNSSTARHPWNLKVLTNNSGSILRSLGPIMGVTVPTLHVGMVFTACCWYRDPHGLPWIEYLHTGASKIWYGIPDESSSAFREVVMELVPNLCRDKTVWLASDTAMIPPNLLVKRGISICRTVQEPGQFILVFPKAFTSSICTGYLVSESVYFAQPSWLLTAQQVFKDVSESSEPSMFSLERLLFSIASDARSHVEVLLQVLPMVKCIRENEIIQRNQLEKLGLVSSERLPLNKRRKSRVAHEDDSDYECETCRANLFLSLVTNTQEQAVYCLTHAIQLLTSKPDHLKYCRLLYTYDMDELVELIEKIKLRIETKSQKKSQNKLSLPASTISSSAPSSTTLSSSSSQTPGSSSTKS